MVLPAGLINPLNDQFFQYRARGADLHLADRFVSTPAIFDRDTFWGLEALLIWKSFTSRPNTRSWKLTFRPSSNGSDPTYTGWYVDAGWFITGETLPYNKGVSARPRSRIRSLWSKGGGWGAWQIAGRYDVLDLTDKATTIQGPPVSIASRRPNAVTVNNACTLCGEQSTWIVGVNWWLNDYSRFSSSMANPTSRAARTCSSTASRRKPQRTARHQRLWHPRSKSTGKADQ